MFSARSLSTKSNKSIVKYKYQVRFFSHKPSSCKDNSSSDTALHTLIRDCKHANIIHNFIKSQPQFLIAKMATITNNQGDIPFDLIEQNKQLSSDDKDKLNELLLDIIKQHQRIKPLSQLLCVDDILKSYYPYLTTELHENLHLAYSTINELRQIVNFSDSHPDINHLDLDNQNEIKHLLNTVRASYQQDIPKDILDVITRYKTGNCHELSYAGIEILKSLSRRKLQAKVISLINGDHVFFIFDSSLSPDINNYLVKNTNAVFCDPWLGIAGKFYRDDLANTMGNHKRYTTKDKHSVNIIMTFNPHYHRLNVDHTYHISANEKSKINASKFKIFDKIHIPDLKTQETTNTYSPCKE